MKVLEYVNRNQLALTRVMENFGERTTPGNQMFRGVLVDPPKVEPVSSVKAKRARLPRKFDYAVREDSNRKLGYGGESWAVRFESNRLSDEGRPDLAAKIDCVSDRLGDGTGYDIMSFESSNVSRFIEVKTTNGGATTPPASSVFAWVQPPFCTETCLAFASQDCQVRTRYQSVIRRKRNA